MLIRIEGHAAFVCEPERGDWREIDRVELDEILCGVGRAQGWVEGAGAVVIVALVLLAVCGAAFS
jgi:hypothetical protein